MKDALHARVDWWLGKDIPDEGEEDYDRWQSMVAQINAIKSVDYVLYLECSGIDTEEFLGEF